MQSPLVDRVSIYSICSKTSLWGISPSDHTDQCFNDRSNLFSLGQLVFCRYWQPLYRATRGPASVSQQAGVHPGDLRGSVGIWTVSRGKPTMQRGPHQDQELSLGWRGFRQTQRQPGGLAAQLLPAERKPNHSSPASTGQEDWSQSGEGESMSANKTLNIIRIRC